jgi:hypothetical protein
MPALVVGLLLYMFPKEVLAKMLLLLMKKLAVSTEWTEVDDELVKILEDRLKGVTNVD